MWWFDLALLRPGPGLAILLIHPYDRDALLTAARPPLSPPSWRRRGTREKIGPAIDSPGRTGWRGSSVNFVARPYRWASAPRSPWGTRPVYVPRRASMRRRAGRHRLDVHDSERLHLLAHEHAAVAQEDLAVRNALRHEVVARDLRGYHRTKAAPFRGGLALLRRHLLDARRGEAMRICRFQE